MRTCLLLSLALVAGCRDDGRGATGHGASTGALAGAHVAALPSPAAAHYVDLAQMTKQNVQQLKLAWTFDTGSQRGHEGAPLVDGSTMYVVTPYPHTVLALDFGNRGAVTWKTAVPDHGHGPSVLGKAPADVVQRGAALDRGTLYVTTIDAHVLAIDAASGAIKWDAQVGDVDLGQTVAMPPLVAGDRVLVGVGGALFGQRGSLVALDAATGESQWRAYSTGLDADVKIGPRFKPFYELDRGHDLGQATWPRDLWQYGGGDVAGTLAYDPQLNLVYAGTGAPAPWNSEARAGDNKWTAGMFARDPATGDAVWFYQFSPHDRWAHDSNGASLLVDLDTRHVIVHADANGYVYVIDRATGEVLSADPYVPVTASRGVDLASGRLQDSVEKQPTQDKVRRDVCPGAAGATTWQVPAMSPQTGLVYIPTIDLCMDFEGTSVGYIQGTPYIGANVKMYGNPTSGGTRGGVVAWDPIARRAAWTAPESFPVMSGTLATAGGLVFYGTLDGELRAVDAQSGDVLWSSKLSSGVIGQPISFEGSDGRQYVAVYAGIGGWVGELITNQLDTEDKTAGRGFANAVKDLTGKVAPGGRLYVFSL